MSSAKDSFGECPRRSSTRKRWQIVHTKLKREEKRILMGSRGLDGVNKSPDSNGTKMSFAQLTAFQGKGTKWIVERKNVETPLT